MVYEPLYLGIDFGTSYFKAGLFTSTGILKGLGKVEVIYDVCDYSGGRFELRVETFWAHLSSCIKRALSIARADARDIVGISYASQANSFVLLDSKDKALSSIILWSDRRGSSYWRQFKDRWDRNNLRQILGLEAYTPEMAVGKLLWFQNEKPEIWAAIDKVFTLSDYFIYSITGERIGDRGTATLLGLWNHATNRWWSEALAYFNLRESMLATPILPGNFAGFTRSSLASGLGISENIPVFVGSLDHHVSGLFPLLYHQVQVNFSLGTVLAAVTLKDCFRPEGGVITGPHTEAGCYFCLSFSQFGAVWLKRLKEKLNRDVEGHEFLRAGVQCILDGKETLELEVDATIASDNLIFKGEACNQSKSSYTAAVLLSLLDQIGVINDRVMNGRKLLRAGICGGASRSSLLTNLIGEYLGCDIISIPGIELGCLGASMLAIAGTEGTGLDIVAEQMADNVNRYQLRRQAM